MKGFELVRGVASARAHSCVLTIGNFDGVHRGHQALLARAGVHARRLGLPLSVLSFEPTPREFFAPHSAPLRIHTLRDKCAALSEHGVQRLVLQRFDARWAAQPAEDFVRRMLVQGLGMRALVVGDDFRFGAGRGGDIALLEALVPQLGFQVEALATVEEAGERCSSTALRAALAKPDLALAARLMGRSYAVSGRVRRGLRLGRELGMPTANLPLRRPLALARGVYAVQAQVAGRYWPAVANLGVRPTLGLSACLLETHILDQPGDLYGREMRVEFHHFLRPEQRFESLEALAAQMQRDKAAAAACFGR